MKNYLYLLLIPFLCLISGCNDDDDHYSIEVEDPRQLNQKLYADENVARLTFTADNIWSTRIIERTVTRATESSAPDWISLERTSGNAGTHTLIINLETNYTGKARGAAIIMTCENTIATIYITQEATDKDGNVPEDSFKKIVSKITMMEGNVVEDIMVFTYDDDYRITKISSSEAGEDMEFTYSNNKVTYQVKGTEYPLALTTLNLNSAGYVTSASSEDGSHWTVTYNNDYIAQSTGVIIEFEDDDDEGTAVEFTHRATWQNNNLVEVITPYFGTTKATYNNIKNNPNINLDLNWIVGGTEGWNFLIQDEDSRHTLILSAMGYYGKRSNYYISKITEKSNDVNTYEYTLNDDGYVTNVIVNGDSKYIIEYKDVK